jgi:triacylglycerol lipase
MFLRLMSTRRLLALAMLCAGLPACAANNFPIVLVHGFLGFGPEQYKQTGFKYWGGFDDIAAHLRAGGKHAVYVTSVGAISSNWDRAAELYYQLKGGCVDYGSSHSARFVAFGAQRQPAGKCWAADPANNPQGYPLALYPQWDADHPVHLMAHSQGGQTVRALIQLLEHGSPNGDEGGGELYAGGKVGWVISATTLAAPHDGTSLRDAVGDFAPRLTELVAGVAKMARMGGAPQTFDFGLEQFGIRRSGVEPAAAFDRRALSSPFWDQENFDSAQHEMGPDGAQEFNAWVRTSPNVYYFSMANVATEAGATCCNETDRLIAPFQKRAYQYPRLDMAPLTKPYAGEWIIPSMGRRGLGSYVQTAAGRQPVDSKWFPNDGVVNTVSMRAPRGQPTNQLVGKPVRGSWNFMGTYRGFDHFDMIGWPRSGKRIYPIYDRISGLLFAL